MKVRPEEAQATMTWSSLHRRGHALRAAGTDEPSSARSGEAPERPPFQEVVDLAPHRRRARHPRTGLLDRLRAALAA